MPIIRHGVPMGLHLARSMPRAHAFVAQACTAKTSGVIPQVLLDEMHAAYQLHDARSTAAVMAGVPGLDITSSLKSIRVPTWIAAGEYDPIVPLAESRRIADAIPGAKLKVYRDAGHMFFCEWPGVDCDFAAWMERVTPGQ